MENVLELDNVSAFYGQTRSLSAVSLNVAAGGVTALLGANGAGKTTTLRAICNMVRTQGAVRFAGKDITGWPTERIAAQRIAHVPEGRGTFTRLTVNENLRVAAYRRSDTAAVRSDLERMYDYFPRLKEREKQQAGMLSGGEQQMLAIARAMMLRPRLMLLDEPSFGLAPLIVQEIYGILKRINRDDGVGILLVEQNAALALALADEAYVLETGSVVISGTSEQIRKNDRIQRAYLGY